MAPEVALAADQALLEQALQQGGVVVERPSPSLLEYLGDVLRGIAFAIARAVERIFDMVGGGTTLGVLFAVILALALLFLVFVLFRLWRTRPRPLPARAEVLPAAATPAPANEDWEAKVEGHLRRGEINAALEALWWWLASRLKTPAVERSWTTRELVLRAGRRDLLRAVMPFDRLLYAAGTPGADDVRGVQQTLRRAVGDESRA